ncbi:B3 domain-containing protein At2g33720-like [Gastrolobium bilobum]|uniref:B3 domain-containing protein At2g33720-like n=1 Tax=Gastrolobium bilobum TaxID=150636 RepID=UPI002AB04962|nr:B3 domain-containing protein At2g33720-like [Gastrolobium bilobum]
MAYDNNVDLCTHLSLARCPCNTMVCTHLSLGKCHCNTTNEDVSVSLTKKRKISEETSVAARKKVCGERSWGYSTDLIFCDDPWKIKKVLLCSDLGNMSRLLLPKDLAENLVVPVLDGDVEKGVQVEIWDVDTASIHSLVFKKWVCSRSYVFIGIGLKILYQEEA